MVTVNVALNKPAYQENHVNQNYSKGNASNAVDGRKSDLTRSGGQCVISTTKETATWWVNLTDIHSIHHITVYYMTNNKSWGASNDLTRNFLGFSLYISNTTDKLQGTLCFKDTNFTLDTIPAVFTTICPVYGQYVIYYNERLTNAIHPEYYSPAVGNNVCEVEVYGCPVAGCYGSNNSFPCPDVNCHYCHKETGTCQVCQPGYKGQRCELECEHGTYGINCSKSCGNCRKPSQCHNVDGSCSRGCSAGYKGPFCADQCDDGNYGIECSETCGKCRNQSQCHHVNGSCAGECSTGYKGTFCTEYCHSTETSMIIGITTAVAVLIVVLVGIVWVSYGKRKRHKIKHSEDESADLSPWQSVPAAVTNASHRYENIELEDQKGESISIKPPRKQGCTVEKIKDCDNGDIDVDEKIHMENPYGDLYLNVEAMKDISLSNLWNIIVENSKNENDGFKKEYAALLYGERYPCEIGKHPENIPKNRFKTTFPYDHSRIVLENQASDYINANFIDGLHRKDEYIATQGPKPSTVDDFWLMIWQENVVQVIMLTNLKEGTRKKCARYWPDLNADKDCAFFIINTLKEKQYANYVIRKILMTDKKENETRTITQYHYITWPDHGVPDPLCLLLFHNHVTRTKPSTHKGPTLVHCSAGIGRTGTYIAIDALHKEMQQENKINIAEYVKKMREKRMNMVQTDEQYKTIFLTLYEMSEAPVTVQKPTEYIEKLETAKLDTPANVTTLRFDFQKLMSVRPRQGNEYYKMVSEGEGLSTTIRPRYENVIIRTSSDPNRKSNIDGIFIHSFTNQNALIVTHCPPADDVVDFLGLITDYDSEVVVFMEPLNSIESTDTWIPTPSRSSKSVPPFTIQLQQENTKENNLHKVEITKENTEFKPRMVHLAAPTHDLTSKNTQTVSQILGLVSFAQNRMGEGPIIVVSKDGAALCGVFCALYNLIQQLTMDEEIDVFSVVRLLQTRRPELCSTMEEYEMINHAMMTFIQSRTDEITYYNQ
nr:receptor-type tyrosine-protein phosphatase epsilon [Crassostrea gigas]